MRWKYLIYRKLRSFLCGIGIHGNISITACNDKICLCCDTVIERNIKEAEV